MLFRSSIFTLLSVLPVSLFGYFDGFKTDSSTAVVPTNKYASEYTSSKGVLTVTKITIIFDGSDYSTS